MLDVYGMELQRWVLPQGTFGVKTHPLMNLHGKFAYSAFVIDPTGLVYRPLRDTRFEDNIQANDSDTRKGQWLTEAGLEVQVMEREEMEKLGMNTLLAVARGSDEPPKLIILRLKGQQQRKKASLTALVGKGVTFDSGGISIKPSEKMEDMKADMAGAAAVLGAMVALGQLRPKRQVIGLIPAVENLPSGKAVKPGDVVKSLLGKTIEVINTDAEGRLILADAIAYARSLGATHLLDIATLTGACVGGRA